MKKGSLFFGVVLSILLLGLLIGCTGTGKESRSGQRDDSLIDFSKEAKSEEVAQNDSEIEESEDIPDESKPEESEEASVLPQGDYQTPFERHGKLSVSGTCIADQNGEPFQLCGVSTHGIGWFPEYISKESFQTLRDSWGANVIRLAMYTAEGAGYCTGGDRDKLKNLVINGVDYATELGMYVIVDWHVLHDLDPNVYKEDAIAFFDEISLKYKDQDNVIYEICNEPNGGTDWSQIKKYAEEVIPVIRANDPDAIIVVGTPTWSQDVDVAAQDPIQGYDNLMYALHFYAATHKTDLRNKMEKALQAGLPLFITEFSICEASGNGSNNIEEANQWIGLADKYHISFAAWNLSNKAESSSLIQSGCIKKSGWSYDDLSDSGKWLVGTLNTHNEYGAGIFNGENGVEAPQPLTPEQLSPTTKGTKDSLTTEVTKSNSWESGSSNCAQYNVVLKNTGTSDLSDWKVVLDFGQTVKVDQIWCAKASVSGSKVTLTPESFNTTVSGGAQISDIGFIISASEAPGKPEVSIP